MKQIRHPLDNLIDDDRLFLMEALIPFADYRLKAPLAVFIKMNELMCIMRALNNPGVLDGCGMNRDIHNQDDVLDALSGCGFADIQNQFSQMKKMSAMMEMMNMMSNEPEDADSADISHSEKDDEAYDKTDTPAESLYDSIMNILNESEKM